MTNAYRWVQWNHHKKVYDLILFSAVGGYLVLFVLLSAVLRTPESYDPMVSMIRALGTCGILLLHVILMIGPLCRISHRFLPLLYNRRHLGVTFYCLIAMHAALVVMYYGGFGVANPLVAVLMPEGRVGPPYELYGFLALMIFTVMAVTSHDFWLANLGAAFWKWMHMGVYVAYVLIIAHVVFGVLRSEQHPIYGVLLSIGVVTVVGLHLIAGWGSLFEHGVSDDGWVDVCAVDEIPNDRAAVVTVRGQERVAIFRNGDSLSAISNVCAHQGGPLGEGKIVDGCVTCPWHGYQYLAACGQSPPPYTERIATYELRIEGSRVLLNPEAKAAGTPVDPAPVNRGVQG